MLENKTKVNVFSPETSLMIGVQLFERLKSLHSIGVIHNDLKPDNILVDEKSGGLLHLIDFGLSDYFLSEDITLDPRTGKPARLHKPRMLIKKFTGNFIFASINSCLGFSRSRKDDLESAFYMIVFFLNNN